MIAADVEEVMGICSAAGLPRSFARRMLIQGVAIDEIRKLAGAYESDGVCYYRGTQWGEPKQTPKED